MIRTIVLIATLAVPASARAGQWGETGTTFLTTLSGGKVVPGPGDADGTGTFRVTPIPLRNQLCYELATQNIAAPISAQIREGARLRVGGPTIKLTPPVEGSSQGCVETSYETALRIVRRPWDFYIDVSTADYPQGAIRGQIGR